MTMFTLVAIRADNPKEGRSQHVAVLPNKILFLYSFSRQEFGEGDHSSRVRKPGQHQGFLYISLAQGSHAVVGMLLLFSVISPEFTAHYDLSDDDALDEVRNGSSPQLDWI